MKLFRRSVLKTTKNHPSLLQLRANRFSTQIYPQPKHRFKTINDAIDSRSSVSFGLQDKPGALEEALRFFRYNKINMTRIYSQWSKTENAVCFFVDMHVDPNHQKAKKLKGLGRELSVR